MTATAIKFWTDIVFKGVLTVAVAAAAVFVSYLSLSGDNAKLCDDMFQSIVTTASQNKSSEAMTAALGYRIGNYNAVCKPILSAQEVNGIMGLMQGAAIPANPPEVALIGWTALSRIPAPDYADTNYDNLSQGDGKGFKTGDVIRARWDVNVRLANTPISRGDNPVVDVLRGGECAKISSIVSGQLNEWAQVERSSCES